MGEDTYLLVAKPWQTLRSILPDETRGLSARPVGGSSASLKQNDQHSLCSTRIMSYYTDYT
jgi:hypothetical protein